MNAPHARLSAQRRGDVGLKSLWETAAALPKISTRDAMQHVFQRSWSNIARAPLTALVSTLTIAVALLLLSSIILLVQNISAGLSASRGDLSLSLYLADSAGDEEAARLAEEIRSRSDVESVSLKSKSQVLSDFRQSLGDQALILDGLEGRNPLPITIEVRLRAGERGEPSYEAFASAFRGRSGIEYVQYSSGLLQQLNTLVSSFRWIGLLAIAFVLLLTGFIISNTIKLALYSHRDEIEIMRLVGATDRFIRAPYVLEGGIQGAAAGIIGLGLSYVLYTALRGASAQLAAQGIFSGTIEFLSPIAIVFVLLIGAAVGLLGSWLAVRRFLPE